jgi:glucose/arabinose dehydrogenase
LLEEEIVRIARWWTALAAIVLIGNGLAVPAAAASTSIGFGKSLLDGAAPQNPTSLQFGPDGRLYVAQADGAIIAYTVERNGPNDYSATATETIAKIQAIPNHNDDGTPAPTATTRLVTGLLVVGTAAHPVLYVTSSDPRPGQNTGDTGADTNSGVISRLRWNGSTWTRTNLVRGLPRSEEVHATNGLQLDPSTHSLYVAQGGNTNMGAPSAGFGGTPEYALSAAVLSIDLAAITNPSEGTTARTRRGSFRAARCRCTRRATGTPTTSF